MLMATLRRPGHCAGVTIAINQTPPPLATDSLDQVRRLSPTKSTQESIPNRPGLWKNPVGIRSCPRVITPALTCRAHAGGPCAHGALNLSCTRKKPVDCQRPRRRVPRPPPIPPPFPPRREGSESPSVVKGAASGALRFLVCPHDLRLWTFQGHQGPGFALKSSPVRCSGLHPCAPRAASGFTLDPLST